MSLQHHHLSPAAIPQAIDLLSAWLKKRLSTEAFAWFETELRGLQTQAEQARWFKALGMAPRKLGKADLQPSDAELQAALALRQGLDPTEWSVDQTARIAFTLAFYKGDAASFVQQVAMLVDTSEINELLAIFMGLRCFLTPKRWSPKPVRRFAQPCGRCTRPCRIATLTRLSFSMKRHGTR